MKQPKIPAFPLNSWQTIFEIKTYYTSWDIIDRRKRYFEISFQTYNSTFFPYVSFYTFTCPRGSMNYYYHSIFSNTSEKEHHIHYLSQKNGLIVTFMRMRKYSSANCLQYGEMRTYFTNYWFQNSRRN